MRSKLGEWTHFFKFISPFPKINIRSHLSTQTRMSPKICVTGVYPLKLSVVEMEEGIFILSSCYRKVCDKLLNFHYVPHGA
jgi:hypothetical protein